jgi:hypothetical protein
MEWEVTTAQQAVNGSSKRLEGESKKQWDLTCLATLSFICTADDCMMIHFPRKDFFLFQSPAYLDVESRSQKVGDLKYFKVCNVQEKEPEINGWDLLSRSGQSFT